MFQAFGTQTPKQENRQLRCWMSCCPLRRPRARLLSDVSAQPFIKALHYNCGPIIMLLPSLIIIIFLKLPLPHPSPSAPYFFNGLSASTTARSQQSHQPATLSPSLDSMQGFILLLLSLGGRRTLITKSPCRVPE